MKKLALLLVLLAAITLVAPLQKCSAQDIWVDCWDDENYDIYVMDDTIIRGSNEDNISFKVAVKQVQNGALTNIILCKFIKWPEDAWRYRTSESDGTNYSAVAKNDPVFEFCMQSLGWNYSFDNGLYY